MLVIHKYDEQLQLFSSPAGGGRIRYSLQSEGHEKDHFLEYTDDTSHNKAKSLLNGVVINEFYAVIVPLIKGIGDMLRQNPNMSNRATLHKYRSEITEMVEHLQSTGSSVLEIAVLYKDSIRPRLKKFDVYTCPRHLERFEQAFPALNNYMDAVIDTARKRRGLGVYATPEAA